MGTKEEELQALRREPAKLDSVRDEYEDGIESLPPLPDDADTTKACELMLPEVMRMYRAIINDSLASASARIAAGNAIMDRAVGKVGVKSTVNDENEITEIEIKFV